MQKLFIRSKTKNEKPYHFLIKKIRIYILAENKLKNSDFFFDRRGPCFGRASNRVFILVLAFVSVLLFNI